MARELPEFEIIDDEWAEIVRRMPLAEKLRLSDRMRDMVILMMRGTMRHIHPDWDDARIERQVRRRMLEATDWPSAEIREEYILKVCGPRED